MRIIKHTDDKGGNILYATCCVYFIFFGGVGVFCLKLRSPFSTFAARNRVGRGGKKRGNLGYSGRLREEMIQPGHLPDKCGDRTGKKWGKRDKKGIKMG